MSDIQKLSVTLTALIMAQDDLTHMNEKGKEYAAQTQKFVVRRDQKRLNITRHVSDMVQAAFTAGQEAGTLLGANVAQRKLDESYVNGYNQAGVDSREVRAFVTSIPIVGGK